MGLSPLIFRMRELTAHFTKTSQDASFRTQLSLLGPCAQSRRLAIVLALLSWAVRVNEAHRHVGGGRGAAAQPLLPTGHQPGGPLEPQLCTLEQGDPGKSSSPKASVSSYQKWGKQRRLTYRADVITGKVPASGLAQGFDTG